MLAVTPLAASALVMIGRGGVVMLIVSVAALVPTALVAEIGTAYTPAVVGVPVSAPVDVLRVSPAGRFVAAYAVGLPLASMEVLTATPT